MTCSSLGQYGAILRINRVSRAKNARRDKPVAKSAGMRHKSICLSSPESIYAMRIMRMSFAVQGINLRAALDEGE
jgi:hypothetical protein